MGDNQKNSVCGPGYALKEIQTKCGRSGTEALCLDYPVCEKKEEAKIKADAASTLQQKSAGLKKMLEGAPKFPEAGRGEERIRKGRL